MVRLTVFALVILAAGPARGSADPNPLAALEPLIGKWEETLIGDGSGKPPNYLELEWELGRKAIRRSEMRTEDGRRWRVTGQIVWNPVTRRIEFHESTDWGNVVTGTIEVRADGAIVRELHVRRPGGAEDDWRTTLRPAGTDAFTTHTVFLSDGTGEPNYRLAGRRLAAFPWENPEAVRVPPGRMVDIGGLRLHIHCSGEGSPPVILDGGAGTWSIHYSAIQEELVRSGLRVCTYDRAGMGWSDAGSPPRTSARMAEQLHALLGKAGLTPPYILAGHSLGGWNVRVFQDRYPKEVAALVLIDAAHERQWEELPPIVLQLVRGVVPSLRETAAAAGKGELSPKNVDVPRVFEGPARAWREAFVMTMLGPKVHETTADIYESITASAAEVPSRKLGDLPLVVLSAGDSFAFTAGTPIPREESNEVWARLQRELAGLSTRSVHLISERGDHALHASDPQAIVRAIQRAAEMVAHAGRASARR